MRALRRFHEGPGFATKSHIIKFETNKRPHGYKCEEFSRSAEVPLTHSAFTSSPNDDTPAGRQEK